MPRQFCIAWVLAAGLLASGANSYEMSFLHAYELARSEAPELVLARLQVDSAEAQKGVARGRLLPQVSLFGQFSDNQVEYGAGTAGGYRDNFRGERYGLQVSQTIFNVADALELSRLDLVYQQSQEEFHVAERELISLLVQTYLKVLLAESELISYETELLALQTQQAESNALYKKKLVPVTDILEIQSRVDALVADVTMAVGEVAVAREELYQLTGQRNVDLVPVNDLVTLIASPGSIEEAAVAGVINSPAVSAAEKAVSAAQKGVDRERGSWIPQVDLTYVYQTADVGFDNLRTPSRDTSTVAIGFNYPLFEGGAKLARLRGARAEYSSAKIRLEAEKKRTESRARSAWLNSEATAKRVVAARKAVISAQTHLDASNKAMRLGTTTATEVLIALSQSTKANKDYLRARFQYIQGWVELELAIGTNPQHLALTLSEALHRGASE